MPPEATLPSRDALFQYINNWALTRGYAFTNGKSTVEKSGLRTVTYSCDRRGASPSPSKQRIRQTASRCTGCLFSVLGKQLKDNGGWALRYRRDERFATHNHEPSSHPTAHPIHRKLTVEQKGQISRLNAAGIAPKEINTYLRQNDSTLATQKDISNQILQSRRDARQGKTSMQALVNQLDQKGFWSRFQVNQNNRVESVLFAHPDSLAYLQTYPELLLLDCTYKTNRFGMPLLDIIGIDGSNRSFCIAFAFLRGENEEDYLWALERLKSLYEINQIKLPSIILTDCAEACINAVDICFPNSTSLLCLWHANKAVLTNCRPTFTLPKLGLNLAEESEEKWQAFFNHWHLIIHSLDQATFEQRVQELEEQYLPTYINEVAYLKSTWLNPYKQKLVKAWVDLHRHFGAVTTSQVEGIHSMLKGYLGASTLDLFEAWSSIHRALVHQLAELCSNQAKQQIRTPIELSKSLYSYIQAWVSHYALRKVEEQRKRLLDIQKPLPACTGVFTRTQGLPCAHTIQTLIEQGQPLQLHHFDKHWHLDRSEKPRLLLEPLSLVEARAARSTQPASSTRRLPSSFEAVEAIGRPKAPPKCSRCYEIGHIMTSKACPLRHQELLNQVTQRQAAKRQAVNASPASNASPAKGLFILPTAPAPAEALATVTAAPAAAAAAAVTAEAATAEEATAEAAAAVVAPILRYDNPRAIYQRYTTAREAWYKAQPRGSIKTNQQYRKAMGLPLRYSKADYDWCLDWKQMNKCCTMLMGSREWSKEEMMAYLDWDKLENDRLDAQVADEIVLQPFSSRRGPGEIWRACEKDIEEQQAFYNTI